MNTKALIDGLVRQTTVLVAHVATSAGLRAPLAHVANQIFLDLTGELERQGVGQKVIADMFGLALRSYQQKLRRLSESATDQGRSLWEAVYEFLSAQRAVRRVEVLRRFCHDDESSVKSILKDLCESGLVYRTGKGDSTVYRRTPPEDLYEGSGNDEQSLRTLVWLCIHHQGPIGFDELAAQIKAEPEAIRDTLEHLLKEQQITNDAGAPPRYRSDECVIPLGSAVGWEVALLDQFQAMVRSMCIKLANGQTRALPDDQVGGSTYTFDVWAGHPQEAAVKALLKETRQRVNQLWEAVSATNATQGTNRELQRVTFYCGQSITLDGPTTSEPESGQH